MTFVLDLAAPNVFPARYNQVSVSVGVDDLSIDALRSHFIGRDAYMRTRFIVLRSASDTALVEIDRGPSDELFSPIEDLRLVAEPSECRYLHHPDLDVGVASQFAPLVGQHPAARCLIVEGRYSHVSFLLNPAPLRIGVLDIVPPAPSKLVDQTQRLLDVAEDLPPIVLTTEEVSSLDLLASEADESPEHVLLPCRTTGVELEGATVSYLDQRPPRQDWTLLGCQRSRQIHDWFYDTPASTVDTCPRRFLTAERDSHGPTLTRCCLLQEGREEQGRTVLVPWGATLHEVRGALEALIRTEGFQWTPI